MGDALPRPKLGDYGLATHRVQLTHTFRSANPVAFDIKSTVLSGLRDKQFDGTEAMNPHEHLSRFAETCEFCVPPATVTDSQKKPRLFPFTLTGRARDWLLTKPSGTIQTWEELRSSWKSISLCRSIGTKRWRFKISSKGILSLYMMLGRDLL